jgi:SAM-dependent methyltransferase
MARAKPKRQSPIDDIDAVRDVGALAHYEDPAYYDKAYASRTHDVAYYVGIATRAKGPVLEYGVGNGRVALAIARAGVSVTGIDASAPMLRSLDERLAGEPKSIQRRVVAVRGDMRSTRLGRKFPLVIAPFNTVLHLYERPDIEAFLGCVRQHLAPKGRFVFDFSLPSFQDLSRDPGKRVSAPRFRHPSTGAVVRYTERFEYHPLRQLLVVWMEYCPADGGESWVVPLSHRQFFPKEMEALLHYNGFTDIDFSADFSDEPPTDEADSLVVSCRLAARR